MSEDKPKLSDLDFAQGVDTATVLDDGVLFVTHEASRYCWSDVARSPSQSARPQYPARHDALA